MTLKEIIEKYELKNNTINKDDYYKIIKIWINDMYYVSFVNEVLLYYKLSMFMNNNFFKNENLEWIAFMDSSGKSFVEIKLKI